MANLKPLSTRPHVNYGQEGSYKLQQERQEGNCEMQLAAWVTLTKAMLNTASPSNQDVFSNRQWRQRRTLTKASWNSTHKNALRFWKSSRCKTIVVIVTLKSMAHPTKMHAAILTIIMHKTTFKKNPQLITSLFG